MLLNLPGLECLLLGVGVVVVEKLEGAGALCLKRHTKPILRNMFKKTIVENPKHFFFVSVFILKFQKGTLHLLIKVTAINHFHMSHIMRKPVYAICEQHRRRSACASVQSDQRLCLSCLDSIIPLLAIADISIP